MKKISALWMSSAT